MLVSVGWFLQGKMGDTQRLGGKKQTKREHFSLSLNPEMPHAVLKILGPDEWPTELFTFVLFEPG